MRFIELEKICSSITDGTHYTPPNLMNGIPFLTVKDMTDNGLNFTSCSFISEEEYDKAKRGKSSPQVGDVLFSKDGTVGKVHVVKEDRKFAVLSSISILTPNSNIVDSEYLGRILATQQILDEATKRKTGSAIRRIILKDLKQVKIPVPPIAQQKRIAAILDKADAVRRKRREAIRLTEELLRSAFLEMFGDPVTNPKGWDVVELRHIIELQGGISVTQKRKEYLIESPYLRVANVFRERLDLSEVKMINVTQKEIDRISLRKGDILVVEGHGNSAEVGRSAVWDGSILNCLHQNHLIRLRVHEQSATPRYVSAFINSPGGRSQLDKSRKTTSGLNTISAKNLRDIKILMPPLSLQQQYTNFCQSLDNTTRVYLEQANESENLFNSLLQRTFTANL